MDLLSRVREDFGIRLIGVQPTGLGADARAVLFRGVTTDGHTYAVKASSAPQPGLAVADFLAGQGVPGVPRPVRARGGGLTSIMSGALDEEETAVSVVPWIDGPRGIDVGLGREHWHAFGELLGAVHATDATALPRRPAGSDGLAEVGALLLTDRHDPAAEVTRARAFPERLSGARAAARHDPILAELASLWARSGDAVLAVADLAEAAARSPRWDGCGVVICHGDPHHANLLLAEPDRGGEGGDGEWGGAGGRRGFGGVWLVDWDDAVLAPREADLIFVIGGVYSFAPITSAEVGWFFEGYTPASGGVTRSDVDAERLSYYRSVRALTDFLDFADDALDPGRPAPERADALRVAADALSAEGIVALTLSETDAEH